ncbi:2-methylene-furan-3-one reductase [Lachnellula occidentalis]|uniref:2-methylene-furan-3-one reductase n=1 Tax=Lachnellula occidentalis TaxID=215460 RepID=A0A8H8RK23_9HELO|nr:2-methylene-furan-3-one reductase [Lachnellula occidentalis]
MSQSIPSSMRALVLPRYCKPAEYDVATVPTPQISKPDELLVKVYAASVNPIDVKMAAGFPYKLGVDLAGVVVAIGSSVSTFKIGDEVYADSTIRGTIAEYALCTASVTALKPTTLSFSAAAAIPLAAQSALQSLQRGDDKIGLRGKTVFVGGALSATGSFGVQMAKKVFGAGKVVTTVSRRKMGRVEELLGDGVVDVVVDYEGGAGYVVERVGRGTVDFMYDNTGMTLGGLGMMKRGGVIVSVTTVPSGAMMKEARPEAGGWLVILLDLVDWFYRMWMRRAGVDYSALLTEPTGSDLERLARWVDEGKIKPIVGRQVMLSDVEGVRQGCQAVLDGKGGIGKFVINID